MDGLSIFCCQLPCITGCCAIEHMSDMLQDGGVDAGHCLKRCLLDPEPQLQLAACQLLTGIASRAPPAVTRQLIKADVAEYIFEMLRGALGGPGASLIGSCGSGHGMGGAGGSGSAQLDVEAREALQSAAVTALQYLAMEGVSPGCGDHFHVSYVSTWLCLCTLSCVNANIAQSVLLMQCSLVACHIVRGTLDNGVLYRTSAPLYSMFLCHASAGTTFLHHLQYGVETLTAVLVAATSSNNIPVQADTLTLLAVLTVSPEQAQTHQQQQQQQQQRRQQQTTALPAALIQQLAVTLTNVLPERRQDVDAAAVADQWRASQEQLASYVSVCRRVDAMTDLMS